MNSLERLLGQCHCNNIPICIVSNKCYQLVSFRQLLHFRHSPENLKSSTALSPSYSSPSSQPALHPWNRHHSTHFSKIPDIFIIYHTTSPPTLITHRNYFNTYQTPHQPYLYQRHLHPPQCH